ncbi:MAG: tRNA glutamyl-Q(34) synthetase GluQRS [Rhodospirillales bacterium]|nr:tRNA glutamyl-Q(34) synthetase GluQRS [Rhodospirillales bacterium]
MTESQATAATRETTRFAPSPSGRLHLGHAYAALFAARAAGGGRFLLRIEDLDRVRARPAFEAAIFEDLAWLGLDWPLPVLRQSERGVAYAAALERLKAEGLLYPCFCTRAQIRQEITAAGQAPHGPEGPLYPGTCRRLAPHDIERRLERAEQPAWRLDLARAHGRHPNLTWFDRDAGQQEARPEILGDVVLGRKDGGASYHLAVVLDDAFQGVSLVTRGRDLFAASHLHRLLQALLDLPVPEWWHHRLIEDVQGQRLAKRNAALSLKHLRESGWTTARVWETLKV